VRYDELLADAGLSLVLLKEADSCKQCVDYVTSDFLGKDKKGISS
jgi:hypothetical protein